MAQNSKSNKTLLQSKAFKITAGLLVLLVILFFVFMLMPKAPHTATKKIASKPISKPITRSVSRSIKRPITLPPKKESPKAQSPATEESATIGAEKTDAQDPRETAPEKATPLAGAQEKTVEPSPTPKKVSPEKALPVQASAVKQATDKPVPLPIEEERETICKLNGIKQRFSGDDYILDILTQGPVKKFKYFSLTSPPRLVIDLLGQWEKPREFEIKIGSSMVNKVRIWRYDDKLRLVSDLYYTGPITPEISESPTGLQVILRKDAR